MALIRTCDRCKAVGSETVEVVTLELAFPPAAELPARRVDLCGECQRDVMAFILQKPVTTTVDGERIPVPSLESIETVERRHIAGILVATKWVKSEAARVLGIERSTLARTFRVTFCRNGAFDMDVQTSQASETNSPVMTVPIEFRPGALPIGVYPIGFGCPVRGENIFSRGAVWFVDEDRTLTPWSVLIVRLTSSFRGESRPSSTMRRGSE